MPSRPFLFCIVFLLGVLGIVSGTAAGQENPRAFLSSFYKIEVFHPPSFVSDLFFSRPNGATPLQMSEKKGVLVVLNLWATWCAPCIAELPSLNRLARIRNDGVDVVAVSVDRKMDAGRIAYYLKRWRVEAIEPLHDTAGALRGRLDTERLPVTYLVGPDGGLRVALYGRAAWESEGARRFLKAVRDDPGFFDVYVKK